MNDADFRYHIKALKSAFRGPDIAVKFGLRRRGKRFFCPLCQEDGRRHMSPDFSVFAEGFRCFKCGETGDIIDLIVLAGKMTKKDAISYMESRSGIGRPETPYQAKAKTVSAAPKAAPGPGPASAKLAALREMVQVIEDGAVHADLYSAFLEKVCHPIQGTPGGDYLVRRGIDADVADRYGIRFCSDLAGLWTLADRKTIKAAGLSSLYVFQKASLPFLAFPYMRRGKPVFIKTRCLLGKDEADRLEIPRFLNTGGAVPCLWNHDAVAGSKRIVITEGEIDALSWIMMDQVAVGLPGWSHWKAAWIDDFAGKEVFLDLDADAAGQKGAADIAGRFERAGLPCPRILARPKDQKDANDLLQLFMKDGKPERRKS